MNSRRTRISPIAIGFVAAGAVGCNLLIPAAVMTQPMKEKVPAEYGKLKGKRAAVMVYADLETLFDYPNVRLEVSAYVSEHIKSRVDDVQFVPPRQVEAYIKRQPGSVQDPIKLGHHFDADVVIQIVLLEFSMRDRELAQFYRGRVRASVAVYDLKDPSGTPQRYALNDVYIEYPPDRPVGFAADAATVVRQKTYEALADAIGRKFYVYEREI